MIYLKWWALWYHTPTNNQDHSKYISQFAKHGINVYANESTINSQKEKHHCFNIIEANKIYKIGNFYIKPFELRHDVPILGFYINHYDNNILFITDSYYAPYRFDNLTNVLLEINYSEAILNDKVEKGILSPIQANRTRMSHFSLENAIDFLKGNDLSKVNNVILLHLSDANSDAKVFKDTIQSLTGKNTIIADKNIIVNLDITPF